MTRGENHPVRVARKAKGWRLIDLAAQVGCSAPMLSMVENGYSPRVATQHKIAAALETAPGDLWPEEYEQ